MVVEFRVSAVIEKTIPPDIFSHPPFRVEEKNVWHIALVINDFEEVLAG